MASKIASGIILLLLFTSMLTLAFNVQPAAASGTIYIKSDGSIEGTDKIQHDGDAYTFTDDIYDSIVVERSNTIIDGAGYTLQGTGSRNGFYWSVVNNVTVKNTNIRDFDWYGILCESTNSCSIIKNNIANNEFGIGVWYSYGNIVSGNNVTSNYAMDIDILGADNNTISGNNVTNSSNGIGLGYGADNNAVSRNNIANNGCGIGIVYSFDIILYENNITDNNMGIEYFRYFSPNLTVYHNNFINNAAQTLVDEPNIWDNGYPSGGNYWSDYTDVDLFSGSNQDLQGMDGIWDHPYVIGAVDQDRYPLVKPYPTIPATLDVDPDKLSLKSKGNWITAYIELPVGRNIDAVDFASIKLNDAFLADLFAPVQVGDHDLDGIPDLMVRFNRTQLTSHIYHVLGIKYGSVTLKVTGKLLDATPFEGSDTIWVNYAGDVNIDGKIDVLDAASVSAHWYPGPPAGPLGYDADTDLNNDGLINVLDGGIISGNWRQTVP